ncbi:hypothetical protein Arub01_01670 [Actinomadura rubrobrunea]|uniref:DUF1579 domain-containing protein n=1 Tax=Actinomadura rubrobrunea TaxID=115335 RepID=A0A9W6UTM5_9ACTN|nr:hypothetical protein [Actinomadura rubrobrunea]GLW61923.1 hypothetical protein Arub01_01670 [Actinomadura rubrobrunea]
MTDTHKTGAPAAGANALARLEPLVGSWTIRLHVEGLGAGCAARTEFTWQDGGAYLRQYSDIPEIPAAAPQGWRDNSPFPTTALIGLDDATGEFAMLYADARGVHRVYRMTFADGVWRIWRDAPGFHQRFTGTLSPDGAAIDARWEVSADGTAWDLDFALTYTRADQG